MSTQPIYMVPSSTEDEDAATQSDFRLCHSDFMAAKIGADLSPKTLGLYRREPLKFLAWLEERATKHGEPLPNVADLNADHVRRYFVWRLQKVTGNTVELEWRQLRVFLFWLIAEGEIEGNPFMNVQPPTPKKGTREIIDLDRTRKLIAACEGNDFRDRRDMAMIRLWRETGIRKGEMASIRLSNVHLDEGWLLVTPKSKTESERKVFFGANTANALRRYIRVRARERWANLDALWITPKGKMAYGVFTERLNYRAAKAGIGHIHPHQFRHTFRHDWGMAGGTDSDLKTAGGWETDKMIDEYGKAGKEERAKRQAHRLALGDRY